MSFSAAQGKWPHSCEHCRRLVLDFSEDETHPYRWSKSRLKTAGNFLPKSWNLEKLESLVAQPRHITILDTSGQSLNTGSAAGCELFHLLLRGITESNNLALAFNRYLGDVDNRRYYCFLQLCGSQVEESTKGTDLSHSRTRNSIGTGKEITIERQFFATLGPDHILRIPRYHRPQ
jgi:hypothetical protein